MEVLITNCTDPMMWYASKIGERVPLIRVIASESCYLCREPAGYSNIVKFADGEVV